MYTVMLHLLLSRSGTSIIQCSLHVHIHVHGRTSSLYLQEVVPHARSQHADSAAHDLSIIKFDGILLLTTLVRP